MKQILILAAFGIMLTPLSARADDFGARFSGDVPSAFGDNLTTVSGGFHPADIEPASGDVSADAFTTENIDQAPSGKTPEELISEIEKLMSEIDTNLDENAAQ